MEGMIGEIRMFAGDFAPRGWLFCDGRLLSVEANSVLFSIFRYTYGGDGETFALPNLIGASAVGAGQAAGGSNWALGEHRGTETNTLLVDNLPAHSHVVQCNNTANSGTRNSPENAFMGTGPVNRSTGEPVNTRYAGTTDGTTMNAHAVQNAGGGQSMNNMQPYLCMNYIICISGVVPYPN